MSLSLLVAGVVLSIAPVGEDPGKVIVSARGADADTRLVFYRVGEEDSRLSLFGQASRTEDVIEFRPSFDLSRGVLYRAEAMRGEDVLVSKDYRIPERQGDGARVVGVLPWWPQSDAPKAGSPPTPFIPANLLKFYIEFDQPMREGIEIFDRIELVDSKGTPVESPWRRQELWLEEAKRLVLFVHPGRIKQGVNLREELGPVMRPDEYYTLRIHGALQDANGRRLSEKKVAYEYDYVTGPEIRERIDPSKWEFSLPDAGTRDSLVIHTERAMDPYLFRRHVSVAGITLASTDWLNDQEWFRLTPDAPWQSGAYTLKVGEFLEDLAGNTPLRVFDTDLEQPDPGPPVLEVPFRIP